MIIGKLELKNALIASCSGPYPDFMKMKSRNKEVIFNVMAKEPHQVEFETLEEFSDKDGNVAPAISEFIKKFNISIIQPKGRTTVFIKIQNDIEALKLGKQDEGLTLNSIMQVEEILANLSKKLGYELSLVRHVKKEKS